MIQNNNQSMKTVVETFLVEETIDLIHDNEKLDKWNAIVNELQLEGQKTIVKEDKSPIPFLWMNSGLIATFKTLCPTSVDVKNYNKTPIPVEILDLVALSLKENYFDFIEIWYNEREKDPVCIGLKTQPEYVNKDDWYRRCFSEKYLIGRWADVKESLDTLVKKAKALYIESIKSQAKQKIRDAQRELEDAEFKADQEFGTALPATNLPF